jgi:O-antigen/teichoic acid export membrane protein
MLNVGVRLTSAAIISGISTYVVLLIIARDLSLADNATFLVFWSAMSLGFGVFTSIQSDATRAAAVWAGGPGQAVELPPTRPRLVTVIWAAGATATLVVALSSPLWADGLFLRAATALALVMAIGQFGSSTSAAYNAVLVGHGRHSIFAVVILLDGLLRLACVVVVVAIGGSLVAIAVATMLPTFTWLLPWAVRRETRVELRRTRSDRDVRRTLAAWGQTVLASICNSALIIGFPVLARITSSTREFEAAAPILLAVMLVRGPLLLPLGAMQTVIIGHVASAHGRLDVPRVWVVRAVVVSVGVVALAAVAGPPILRVVKSDYDVSGPAFGGIALGSVLLAVFTLVSTIVLGRGRHSQYLIGWAVALAAVVVVLLLPVPFEPRIVTSIVVGPIAGMTVHLLWPARRSDLQPTSAA